MKVDAKIYQTDTAGNTLKTTVAYIKPTATNTQIVTLAQAINSVTTNTYTSTHRIEDKEIVGNGE